MTVFAFCGALAATVFAAQAVHAQSTLSQAQIEHIRQNCVAAQTTIKRIHGNDVSLRYDRDTLYDVISVKLMAPLNSRIALGRFEGLKLAATTLEYDRQREVFVASYRQYDEAMIRLLKIHCTEKPVEFYESLQAARELRQKLHDTTQVLVALLEVYGVEFDNFVAEFEGADE